MGIIRYSCGHISGHHEPIHVKFGVWGFFIMFYWNLVIKMLNCKKENLMTSHFGTLWPMGKSTQLSTLKCLIIGLFSEYAGRGGAPKAPLDTILQLVCEIRRYVDCCRNDRSQQTSRYGCFNLDVFLRILISGMIVTIFHWTFETLIFFYTKQFFS